MFFEGVSLGFFLLGNDVDVSTGNDFTSKVLDLFGLELHETIDKRKECVVLTLLDVLSGMKFGATLANDDVPYRNRLVAVDFDAETF